MVPLTSLWLPILLSAVFVFIASTIIHMAPLWHRKDYPAAPNQDGVMDALRPLNIPPGDYMVPRAASMAEMKTKPSPLCYMMPLRMAAARQHGRKSAASSKRQLL